MDPEALIHAIQNGLPKIPAALLAAALLGGPTAIWLITRIIRPPSFQNLDEELPVILLWACVSCRSVNEDRLDRCYRCHLARTEDSVPIILHPERDTGPRVALPIGSGLAGQPPVGYGWLGGEFTVPVSPTDDRHGPPPAIAPVQTPIAPAARVAPAAPIVPAAPIAADPVIIEPRIRVSGRESAVPPPARQPRNARDKKSKRTPGSPRS